MNIVFHRNFYKKYQKLRKGDREKFKKRRDLFIESPFDSTLHNHLLQGKYQGYRSIRITGDLRVVYRLLNDSSALFVDIDTHSNLYS
jgi:addiction module RelE/StbE family toxin